MTGSGANNRDVKKINRVNWMELSMREKELLVMFGSEKGLDMGGRKWKSIYLLFRKKYL